MYCHLFAVIAFCRSKMASLHIDRENQNAAFRMQNTQGEKL